MLALSCYLGSRAVPTWANHSPHAAPLTPACRPEAPCLHTQGRCGHVRGDKRCSSPHTASIEWLLHQSRCPWAPPAPPLGTDKEPGWEGKGEISQAIGQGRTGLDHGTGPLHSDKSPSWGAGQ